MSNLYLKEALTYFKTKCNTFFCKKQDIINNAISTNTDKPVSAAVATNLQGQITTVNNNLIAKTTVSGAHMAWATIPATAYWNKYYVFIPMFNAYSVSSVTITSVATKSGNSDAEIKSIFSYYAKTRDGLVFTTTDATYAGKLCLFSFTVTES